MLDVIVPVYIGEATTRRCLESLYACRNDTAFEIVVVNDASPEKGLADWLESEARAGRCTLLRQPENRGFVAAVNTGMALHADRDVVLLNSDTEVAGNWLDRIVACSESSPAIATITPFSNNATICSYPFEGWRDDVPGTLGLGGLDGVFARELGGKLVDLPTAVGFCMYIRRECLQQIGLFDEQAFGRGYGEENDFCLRASKAGWRNVMACDVFVYHRGAVSFGESRHALMRKAEQTLLARYPDYNERVAAFIQKDVLRPFRNAVHMARLEHGADEARHVLQESWDERQNLLLALRTARRNQAMPRRPRPLKQLWQEFLAEAIRRFEAGGRWGPRRRKALVALLRVVSAVTPGST